MKTNEKLNEIRERIEKKLSKMTEKELMQVAGGKGFDFGKICPNCGNKSFYNETMSLGGNLFVDYHVCMVCLWNDIDDQEPYED